MSIPPFVELIVIESPAFSVELILTELPVATISMSSPAAAPLARMSIPPAVDSIFTASLADSVACRMIEPPVLTTEISSPAEPTASMSIPPALATMRIASAAFWLEARFICSAQSASIPPAAERRVMAFAAASSPLTITRPASELRVRSFPAPVTS